MNIYWTSWTSLPKYNMYKISQDGERFTQRALSTYCEIDFEIHSERQKRLFGEKTKVSLMFIFFVSRNLIIYFAKQQKNLK